MVKKIEIVGLGAGDLEQLPVGVYKKLLQAPQLFLRTKEHPVIPELEKEGLSYTSFDGVYEKYDQFEAVYEEIAKTLLKLAQTEAGDLRCSGTPTRCRADSAAPFGIRTKGRCGNYHWRRAELS